MSETREPLAMVDETLVRNCGLIVLRGVAAMIFGILTLFQPGIALWMLVPNGTSSACSGCSSIWK